MPRIKLVLADTDEGYIEGLGRYIRNNCDGRMEIHIFTRQPPLEDFLQSRSLPADMLLVSPDLLSEKVRTHNKGGTVLLLEEKAPSSDSGYPGLFKYQRGEQLYKGILEQYEGMTGKPLVHRHEEQNSKILTVFSPQGGSGKSVVAFMLAAHYARKGLRVFFLSLDALNCTPFFTGDGLKGQGLSNVLYYLKQDASDLPGRITAAAAVDALSGVSGFGPPDCSQDLEEATEEDIIKLLCVLKETGRYDLIVTDMDTCLHKRSLAVLTNSQALLMVLAPDQALPYRISLWEAQMKKAVIQAERVLSDSIPVINRYPGASADKLGIRVNGLPVKHKIPVVPDLYLPDGEAFRLNLDSRMMTCMTELAGSILEKLAITVVRAKA